MRGKRKPEENMRKKYCKKTLLTFFAYSISAALERDEEEKRIQDLKREADEGTSFQVSRYLHL
jgi:hypothetical protein